MTSAVVISQCCRYVTNSNKVTTNAVVLYLVKTERKTAVQHAFSTQLYTKPQWSADLCGPRWKEAQTRSTAAPNRTD
jgi:hypothetical protein